MSRTTEYRQVTQEHEFITVGSEPPILSTVSAYLAVLALLIYLWFSTKD